MVNKEVVAASAQEKGAWFLASHPIRVLEVILDDETDRPAYVISRRNFTANVRSASQSVCVPAKIHSDHGENETLITLLATEYRNVPYMCPRKGPFGQIGCNDSQHGQQTAFVCVVVLRVRRLGRRSSDLRLVCWRRGDARRPRDRHLRKIDPFDSRVSQCCFDDVVGPIGCIHSVVRRNLTTNLR